MHAHAKGGHPRRVRRAQPLSVLALEARRGGDQGDVLYEISGRDEVVGNVGTWLNDLAPTIMGRAPRAAEHVLAPTGVR